MLINHSINPRLMTSTLPGITAVSLTGTCISGYSTYRFYEWALKQDKEAALMVPVFTGLLTFGLGIFTLGCGVACLIEKLQSDSDE